jgi:hypothetical protein
MDSEGPEAPSRITPISGTAASAFDTPTGVDDHFSALPSTSALEELKRVRDMADARALIGGTHSLLAVPLERELNIMQRVEPILVAPDARVAEFGSLRPSSLPANSAGVRSKHLWLLLLGAFISAGIGGGIALLTRNVPAITVTEFSISAEGNDRLTVECPSCADGTRIKLGVAAGAVRGNQAELLLKRRLAFGPNTLLFSVETLDGSLTQARPVVLPVAFRMTTRWVVDDSAVPVAEIVVGAPHGSTVFVDGKLIPLNGERAVGSVPFRNESQGQSANVLPLHIDVPVLVEHGGQRKETRAVMTGGVCPLTFQVKPEGAGRGALRVTGTSAPAARLTMGDEVFHAGKDGSFSFRFESDGRDRLQLIAKTEELLPRRAPLSISP